jgi:mannosylglycerate hydrolase
VLVGSPEIYLVPHTHWDREWYQPFDEFLVRLVRMMDGLIELLGTDDRFAHFHLDGQVAMIDDYLAVRPEREGDVRRLAAEGRISVGPWYTQMDEFLVSGESLVRNLEWGLSRARDLAGDRASRAGYLPDQFGHVGQMPQILRAAGIERAVLWRGVPAAMDKSAFWWESPDGSRVLAEYLAFGYSLGLRLVSVQDAETLATELKNAVGLLEPISVRDRLLITVGSDHQGPAAKLPPLLEEIAKRDELDARVGSISGYLDAPDPEGIPTWRGELRSAARAHLLPGVYSTRAHQKRERARVEALVERVAEPLAALVPGFEWPEEELREVWRLLLWNGAHDSVCGCSVDQVARGVRCAPWPIGWRLPVASSSIPARSSGTGSRRWGGGWIPRSHSRSPCRCGSTAITRASASSGSG